MLELDKNPVLLPPIQTLPKIVCLYYKVCVCVHIIVQSSLTFLR